jgi:outer membrane protein TolC
VQNGKAILVEQLDALAALTQARTNVAQALYDHSLAAARLQRAVGRP